MSLEIPSLGSFEDRRLDKKGAELLDRIVVRQTICLRQLAEDDRAQEVAFGRFLANEKVTAGRLIEGWSGCSTSVSVNELRSARIAGQERLSAAASPSAAGLAIAATRSSSSFFGTRARKLHETWPRMVSSSL